MKILTDLHTHTSVSTHAHSTITENVRCAAEKGLELIAMTNHAPALPDSAHLWHFQTLCHIPRIIDGVVVIRGAEANILDKKGTLDLTEVDLKPLELVIASIHSPVFRPSKAEDYMSGLIGALKNPYVDIIGHPGRTPLNPDYRLLASEVKKYGKAIEINNHTLSLNNPTSIHNCTSLVEECKRQGTLIAVSSDAHICYDVGDIPHALRVLKDLSFPEELIMNRTKNNVLEYLKERKNIEICI